MRKLFLRCGASKYENTCDSERKRLKCEVVGKSNAF